MASDSPNTGGPSATARTARLTHVVAMVDVDLVQINFTAYFRWMDMGYDALLVALGRPLSRILADGLATPAVDARCRYVRPVGLDDVVEAVSWISETGRTSYAVAHRFTHEGSVVAEGLVRHVWIAAGPPATPVTLPDWLRAAADPPPGS